MTDTTEHDTIYTALVAAQAELQNPDKGRTAKVQGTSKTGKQYEYEYKYADIADVLNGVRPVLSKHGISLTQPTKILDGGHLVIETVLAYRDGTHVSSIYPVCSVNNDHQAMGAAMTYARRYALTSLIGIAAEDDTDAQGAAKASGGNQMSVQRAKTELNYQAMVDDIRSAKTTKKLENWRSKLAEREGTWPSSYIEELGNEIDAREQQIMAEEAERFDKMSNAELDQRAMKE